MEEAKRNKSMELDDLMINDWVNFDGRIVKVEAINGGAAFSGGYFCGIKYVEPIKLTEEMFTMNGFLLVGEGINEFKGINQYRFDAPIEDVRSRVRITWHGKYKCFTTFIFNSQPYDICYVHQFQQLLRLANMKDLANNFKIK